MKKTLHVIPHSHWDREWYLPFEKHRTRLVTLMDELIEVMEKNEDYTYYHLDGQYIVIEDYLAIRPHMRERLLKLIRARRIQIGPWYVLQDEYLTSGEANVRNMLYGIKLCKELGAEPVETGYFPDAFGNISQAPQILRGFGIDNAVFGRGINDVASDNKVIRENGICQSELIWRAPDGSEVIGVMFAGWYHNAMELPSDPDALRVRLAGIVASTEKYATTEHLLGMNGCDHQPLQKNLHEVIRLANELQDEVTVKQSSFTDYIEAIRPYRDRFSVYEGEINGQLSAGACPLISTASAHIDIKQKNYLAQHLLERIAEPIGVLSSLCGGRYDGDLYLYAWKTLMQNHPHDSICSCSCDEVYEEMKTRFAKAQATAEALRDEALDHLAATIDTSGATGETALLVFSLEPNASLQTVRANIDLDLADETEAIAVFDENGNEVPATYTRIPHQFTYTLPKDRFRQPKYVNRFAIEMQVASHGIGCRVFGVRKQKPTVKTRIVYGDGRMENEFLRVRLNQSGTVDVTDKRSGRVYKEQNLFEDAGDVGNLYNYIAPEGDVPLTSRNAKAKISLDRVTPWSVTYKAELSLSDALSLTSYVTLSDGVARVDFKTVVTNHAENHRLRALFETGIDSPYVYAEGQFDLVRREIQPSPFWKNPCNAQRAQAFLTIKSESAGAVLLAARGICEYEVLRDGKNTLALTLLRAVGEIGDWGVFPTPLGQKKGTWTLEYAFVPYESAQSDAAYKEGYTFAYPATVAIAAPKKAGALTLPHALLKLDNEYIRLTALKRSEDGASVIARMFNTTDKTITARLFVGDAFTRACLTDLKEEPLSPLAVEDGAVSLPFPPKKILTLSLSK